MTSRVSIKNKEKKAKRKNSAKKERLNREKKLYKETENSVVGSRTRFICTFKQLLDHCTTVTHLIWKINYVISKQFFSAVDAVWSWWSCIYHELKYTFEENKFKRVFQSYFALFRVQRADSDGRSLGVRSRDYQIFWDGYCLDPRPHYSARPKRFGSRGPSKNASVTSPKWIDQ